jgi:hypothetical protein
VYLDAERADENEDTGGSGWRGDALRIKQGKKKERRLEKIFARRERERREKKSGGRRKR